jgi:diguanylate cyclase (GGDEF)-like protein
MDGMSPTLSQSTVGPLAPLFDNGRFGVVIVDPAAQSADLSPTLCRRLGLPGDAPGARQFAVLRERIDADDLAALTAVIASAKPDAVIASDFRIAGPDDVPMWWTLSGYKTAEGQFVGLAIDITDRKRTERLLSLQRDGLEQLARGAQPAELIALMVRAIEEVDPELKLICFEPRRGDPFTVRYVGGSSLPPERRAKLDHISLAQRDPDAPAAIRAALQEAGMRVARLNQVIDGPGAPVGLVAFAHEEDSGALGPSAQGLMPIIADVMLAAWEQWSKDRRIAQLAYFDPLTGLGNRRRMDETISQVIGAAGPDDCFAVMVVDLDGFKPVNDVFGHNAGDHVLRELAHRMAQALPDGATLCRPGGDEFLVYLPNVRESAAMAVARTIAGAVRPSIEVSGAAITVTASIGIALYPEDGITHAELFRAADLAMYQVKRKAKDGVRRYRSAYGQEAYKRFDFMARLRKAVDSDQLRLHFQPQVDVAAGRLAGAECLLRWRDEKGRVQSPVMDLGAFEASDIMTLVDRWVVTAACQHMLTWQNDGLPVVPLSLNLSPQRLGDAPFVEHLIGLVEEFGIAPDKLRIELTEGEGMRLDGVSRSVKRLRDHGLAVYMDDFGTRFAHLETLRALPISGLKIDRSLVAGVSRCERQRGILSSVVVLARRLNLTVIVEGVEREEDRAELERLGLTLMQGYLFSSAVDADTFTRMLASDRSSDDGASSGSGARTRDRRYG